MRHHVSRSRRRLLPLVLQVACWISSSVILQPAWAFLAPTTRTTTHHGIVTTPRKMRLLGSRGEAFDSHDTQLLKERLHEMRLDMLEEELNRPPNPDLSPHEFVTKLIKALYNNEDPLPDSGFRLLLRASTKYWRGMLHDAVGAPREADEEAVASALGIAMGRPHNQFGILVGEGERFDISFPTEPLDYSDGTCWVECRLRDKRNDSLLVIIGWELEQRPSDGAWLVDRIEWQDFRDEFRPGIGREEWMRICG